MEFWWGNLGERDHLEDLSINGRIMVRCILIIKANKMHYFSTSF